LGLILYQTPFPVLKCPPTYSGTDPGVYYPRASPTLHSIGYSELGFLIDKLCTRVMHCLKPYLPLLVRLPTA